MRQQQNEKEETGCYYKQVIKILDQVDKTSKEIEKKKVALFAGGLFPVLKLFLYGDK